MNLPVAIVPPPLNLPKPTMSYLKGHRTIPDLTGARFGSLVVESRLGCDGQGNSLWNCVCDCGHRVATTAAKLNSGRKSRCRECAQAARLAAKRERKEARPVPTRKQALERKLLASLKRKATTEGYAWTIWDEEALALLAAPCRFCAEANTPGTIVRIHPDEGWRPDNCLPACPRCAASLGNGSPADFVAWTTRIAENCPPGQPL